MATINKNPVTVPNEPTQQTQENQSSEEELRKLLRQALQNIKRREPLEPTYAHCILRPSLNHKPFLHPPKLPTDPMYCRSAVLSSADLRERVEAYMKTYGVDGASTTSGKNRPNLEDAPMKAAFTLREAKIHEQEPLILAATAMKLSRRIPGMTMEEGIRKIRLEAMTRGLQEDSKTSTTNNSSRTDSTTSQKSTGMSMDKYSNQQSRSHILLLAKQKILDLEEAAIKKERDNATDQNQTQISQLEEQLARFKERIQLQTKQSEQERLIESERQRQRDFTRTAEEEQQQQRKKKKLKLIDGQEQEQITQNTSTDTTNKGAIFRLQQHMDSPQQSLHRLYYPIFQALWDMEFDNLNRTNPFRIVIDKTTCEAMGIPDYCDVIAKPMNLTFIQEKVELKRYTSLQEFFDDVELMIHNALTYNSDPRNPYHVATLQLRKRYKKLAKMVTSHATHNSL